jgi:hypothetical protein
MSIHNVKLIFTAIILATFLQGCEFAVAVGDDPLIKCDVSDKLTDVAVIAFTKLSESGANSCHYTVTIVNTGKDFTALPILYYEHKDAYNHLDTKYGMFERWDKFSEIGPGASLEFSGDYITFIDPDAYGSSYTTLLKIAAINKNIPECAAIYWDKDKLEDYLDNSLHYRWTTSKNPCPNANYSN